ncbi:MAG: DUF2871 domain-containing protein [Erysipelotrichaceae bacterium]|nr:DUF2871 domain-containing protein [Erysipelotrichaceae bacterium]
MKKLINTAFIYMVLGAIGGVLYRETTRLAGYTGVTALGYVHPHLIGLGAGVFLILALFAAQKDFTVDNKDFNKFYLVYNGGMAGMNIMFLVRGFVQVFNLSVSNGAISGIAGLTHICMFAGLWRLFSVLKKTFA